MLSKVQPVASTPKVRPRIPRISFVEFVKFGANFCEDSLLASLRARAEITSHFAAGPQARWRGASDELRREQQSQRACGPQPEGARRRAGICFVAAPRRCPTSTASRRLASARPALAPKCEFISARALSSWPADSQAPPASAQEFP